MTLSTPHLAGERVNGKIRMKEFATGNNKVKYQQNRDSDPTAIHWHASGLAIFEPAKSDFSGYPRSRLASRSCDDTGT